MRRPAIGKTLYVAYLQRGNLAKKCFGLHPGASPFRTSYAAT